MTSEQAEEIEIWSRVYPEEGVLDCPFCYDSFWRPKQREKHVRDQHGAIHQRWRCSACSRDFPSKLSVANHFAGSHATTSAVQEEQSDDEEEGELFSFSFCDRTLPSRQGLRNHERASHQAAVSACLALTGSTTNKAARRWSEHEIARFKEAVRKVGVNSNIAIAQEVGTRDAKQCGNFKRRFPEWAKFTEAPPPASQPSPMTPTTCSSVNSNPSPQSRGATILPRSTTASVTPSPTLRDLLTSVGTPPLRPTLEEDKDDKSPPCGQDWRRPVGEEGTPFPTWGVATPIGRNRGAWSLILQQQQVLPLYKEWIHSQQGHGSLPKTGPQHPYQREGGPSPLVKVRGACPPPASLRKPRLPRQPWGTGTGRHPLLSASS